MAVAATPVPTVVTGRRTARRRRIFDSHAAALDNYRIRIGFKTWPRLEAYIQHAFCRRTIKFAWRVRRVENTFAHTEHNPWPGIRQLRCPVIALAERRSTFSPAAQNACRPCCPADVGS